MTCQIKTIAFLGLFAASSCSAPVKPAKPSAKVDREKPPKPERQLPPLESRLNARWLASATRLQTGDAVIYYRGSVQRASAEGEPWAGLVQGDILLLSPRQAVLIPSGTLILQGRDAIKVSGPHRTILARPGETPNWQESL